MFKKRLKTIRKYRGFTQEDLAKKVNTRKTTISNYETGYSTPSNEMLIDLAKALNVSTDYLLGLSDQNEIENDDFNEKNNKLINDSNLEVPKKYQTNETKVESFGKRLKKLRIAMNLSKESLADKLKISPDSIDLYEEGEREPTLEILEKISQIFHVSFDFLLTGQDVAEEKDPQNLFFFNREGLTDQDIEEIKKQIEFMKWKAEQEKKRQK